MVEHSPPPLPDLEPPVGPPAYAWFDGVVEGARGESDAELHRAVSTIQGLRFGRADLELDGPRFSLLMTGETVDGQRIDDAAKQQFVAALARIAASAGPGRPIESTLRCTEVYFDRTIEILFGFERGEFRVIGRVRSTSADDQLHDPRRESALPPEVERADRRRALIILALMLVAGGALLWQGGWIDRLRSADPADLPILTTEFDSRLEVGVTRSFGAYVVEVGRGPTFPDTDEKLSLWQQRTEGAAERMAYQSLAHDGTAYLHLLGKDMARLRTVKIDLRPILLSRNETVIGRLPGHPEATGFAVSPTEKWGK